MSNIWERKEMLFDEALELPVADRAAFIVDQAADDPTLREELLQMLRSHEAVGDFLQTQGRTSLWPLAAEFAESKSPDDESSTDETLTSAMIGRRIGSYEVVSVLGAGGMGVVYEAEQREPRRRVALKVMRLGLASRGALRRFRLEAEVLGRLQHPGIARIIEAGTEDLGEGGQPYFAMELVRGRSLLDYAAHENLSLEQRVRLFVRICEAVQYAHQNGVVHRDLKPANVLVEVANPVESSVQDRSRRVDDVPGLPKILDFGVARLTDPDVQVTTLLGDAGGIVGTLAYMSPEQIAGHSDAIDARTDVHALGVILFELLTGELPFDIRSKSLPEAMWIISEQEARRLSSVRRGLRGDLNTIVAKAIAKRPERRYASVRDLAEDLERYLNHEPIRARRPSAIYALGKFVRRNRAVSAALAAIFITMTMALALVNQARLEAINAKVEEERQYAEARRMSTFFLRDVVTRLERVPGATAIRRDLLEEMLRQSRGFLEMRGEDPDLLHDHALTLSAMANLLSWKREYPEARSIMEEVRALRERLVEIAPDNLDYWMELGIAYASFADFARLDGNHEERLAVVMKVYEIDKWLLEQDPDSRRFRDNLFWSIDRVASTLHTARDPVAREWAERGLQTAYELNEQFPDHYLTAFAISKAHLLLGTILRDFGELDDAAQHHALAIEHGERLNAMYPNSRYFLWHMTAVYTGAGRTATMRQDTDIAIMAYTRLREVAEELDRSEPNTEEWQRRIREASEQLARLERQE